MRKQRHRGVKKLNEKFFGWGAWGAQSIKLPSLGLGSGHDLRVMGSSPMSVSGSLLSTELACPSPSLTVPLLVLSVSQINKYNFLFKDHWTVR